jgi:Secretion system C-terminal sorting domain
LGGELVHVGYIWMVKTDSIGTLQWQKCIGGSGGEEINSIAQTSDGGYVLTGTSYSTDGDITGVTHSLNDYCVIKTDNVGTPVWQAFLGGSDDDFPKSIIATNDGGCIVAGTSKSLDFDVTGNHGNEDYWIVKLSSTVGMAEEIMEDGISIYPNPNNGKFMITFNAEQKKAKLKITDVLGNTIRQTDIVNQQTKTKTSLIKR